MRTRFAPSPTGLLHLGHAYSALFAFDRAQAAGGSFILRIEDLDPVRCRPEYIQSITDDLEWLGLSWPRPVRRQSEHLDDYAQALDRLDGLGLLYPCFCTRADIAEAVHAPHGPEGQVYGGRCKALGRAEVEDRKAAGSPFALRLHMDRALKLATGKLATGKLVSGKLAIDRAAGPLEWVDEGQGAQIARPELFGDVVLARKDVPASYHLAVTVDDAGQDVTLVTRGQDLFAATHVHRLLQALLDLPTPLYHHHGLIVGPDGKRLAKRDRAQTLGFLRSQGYDGLDVRKMVGLR